MAKIKVSISDKGEDWLKPKKSGEKKHAQMSENVVRKFVEGRSKVRLRPR